jgi:nucleoside-diphosphate-sugar epimerase
MTYLLSAITKYPAIKLVYISSGGVYGIENHPNSILSENVNCYPDTIYEKTKLNAEFLLSEFAKKNNLYYTILRPTNVFGEFDKGMKLLNLFIALQKKRFFYINKKSIVNYLYVRQLSDTIKLCFENDFFENEIYNVNSACTIEEFIEQSKKALNLHYTIKKIPLGFLGLLLMIAKLADMLPSKYQLINSGKLRELTSEKYYSTEKIQEKITINEFAYLKTGIENLVKYYKSINKL